jgi:hypothetical protein
VPDKCGRENQNTHFIFGNFFPKVLPFMSKCGKIWYRQAIDDSTVGRIFLRTHTQNMYCLLLFHGNSRYMNAPPRYVIRAIPVLFNEAQTALFKDPVRTAL